MTVADHVTALESRHRELEQIIENESGQPRPDQSVIARLKKEKLRIKDELTQISAQ